MDIVTEIYEDMREEIYLKYNIVNIDKVKKRQEDLFALNDYLPLLIRTFCDGYFTRMEKNGVIDKVFEKMRKVGKHKSREFSVNEFIDWIGKHDEFEDLLNRRELKKLYDEIDKLEEEKQQTIKILT